MSNYKEVLSAINHLDRIVPNSFSSRERPDWKAIWKQIKSVGSSFKGVRFPSHEEHQDAWNHFQDIVSQVKDFQNQAREEWEQKKENSTSYKYKITAQAKTVHSAISDGFGDFILNLFTGGLVSLIEATIDAVMGPFDDRKRELLEANRRLKKGWDMLNEYKKEMLGNDRREAFEALNNAKEFLDEQWETYKSERESAFDKYKDAKKAKYNAWREKVEDNLQNLENRRDKLNAVLTHKESHLDTLRDKLYDAKSDDYRELVSGWIDEEESSIEDIRNKLDDIADWIYDNRSKLD